MYHNNSNSADSQLNKVMNDDQFNQVVDAILSGKYSWACLLILRFSGYNPLHYIPYRTYNRIMKTNRQQELYQLKTKVNADLKQITEQKQKQLSSAKIQDLHFQDELTHQSNEVIGGKRSRKIFSLGFLNNLLAS